MDEFHGRKSLRVSLSGSNFITLSNLEVGNVWRCGIVFFIMLCYKRRYGRSAKPSLLVDH